MSPGSVTRFLKRLDEERGNEVENDVGPLRGLSLEERGKIVESVCRDAMAIMRARPDFVEAIVRRDERTAWLSAVRKFREHESC